MVEMKVAAEDPRGRSALLIREKGLSQHNFKSRRRYEAIERREKDLADAKMENVNLKLEVAYLRQELESWNIWWSTFEQLDDVSGEGAVATEWSNPIDEVEETLIADTMHDWRDYIVWTPPSTGRLKGERKSEPGQCRSSDIVSASAAYDDMVKARQASLDSYQDPATCSIVNAPVGFDEVLIYTEQETTMICESLVKPLAARLHGIDEELHNLQGHVTCHGGACSLGKLLRDLCNKLVPLTSILHAKEQVVHRMRVLDQVQLSSHGDSFNRDLESDVDVDDVEDLEDVEADIDTVPRFPEFADR